MSSIKPRRVRDVTVAHFKRLLSYSKADWDFKDYPSFTRRQTDDGDSQGQRTPLPEFVAYIVNWGLVGTGDTPEEARRNLEANFQTAKQNRTLEGKLMPRPGSLVLAEFASDENIERNRALSEDFINRALELQWAFISDESSLWDFHTETTNALFHQRIKDIYGVDVADIASGRLWEILDRIAAHQAEKSAP
jgi:hypothetical protein